MSQPIYVRHISGQGKIYKVFDGGFITAWMVDNYQLPKDEYVVCEHPEPWEDVTSQCEVGYGLRIYMPGQQTHDYLDTAHLFTKTKYRLRKVPYCGGRWAFIVERQVHP